MGRNGGDAVSTVEYTWHNPTLAIITLNQALPWSLKLHSQLYRGHSAFLIKS